jgi:hypothetical protein
MGIGQAKGAMVTATAARAATIEGRSTLVVDNQSTLPRSLADLLGLMAPFGFAERQDFTLAGTRTACEVLRAHRWRLFRRGHWSNQRAFSIVIGQDAHGLKTQTVPAGMRQLRLDMCADCGAVAVHDITPSGWAGAKPVRLVNRLTGVERVAPAVGQPDLVIGWYSGKRRAGREYHGSKPTT